MATLRKFRCYRSLDRPYTRKSKFKKKAYIKVVPAHKIVRFDMGNLTKNDWKYKITLRTKDTMQIRQNALESSRMLVNRRLNKLGPQNFHFKINIFPHQVLRENKALSGAGADRLSTGMKHSFGKSIGTAARVKKGDAIMTAYIDGNIKIVEDALKSAGPKLPGHYHVETEKLM